MKKNASLLSELDSRPVAASVSPLLDWYRKNARPLPWRKTRNPYYIWLSEIMLQ